jgi:hypothetical protein
VLYYTSWKNKSIELSASLRNWNIGIMEWWNEGVASFGQINAFGGNNSPGTISIMLAQYSVTTLKNQELTIILNDLSIIYKKNLDIRIIFL